MTISDEERMRRKRAVDQARANVRLEGTILPAAIEEINRRFIEGEITGDEHVRLRPRVRGQDVRFENRTWYAVTAGVHSRVWQLV